MAPPEVLIPLTADGGKRAGEGFAPKVADDFPAVKALDLIGFGAGRRTLPGQTPFGSAAARWTDSMQKMGVLRYKRTCVIQLVSAQTRVALAMRSESGVRVCHDKVGRHNESVFSRCDVDMNAMSISDEIPVYNHHSPCARCPLNKSQTDQKIPTVLFSRNTAITAVLLK